MKKKIKGLKLIFKENILYLKKIIESIFRVLGKINNKSNIMI